ncbi:Clp protease N-terminal domain-containing protein [Streptomyces sp. NPDC058045]|uniref:Clp protease N-terminal domain-containing protein n=1 Tax=Streptomyces sp. NPDC058045 TaxID=3346311 RepID=UPI0036E40571
MFERFTEDARSVLTDAAAHAGQAGERVVDDGDVLLAVLLRTDGRAAAVLDELGAGERRTEIRQGLAETRRRAGLTRADAEALAGLGIDLGEIVSRVEEVHGEGALAVRGRRTRSPRLTPAAKQVLERALRIAAGHRDRFIGDQHLLLALLSAPGAPADALAEQGVTYEAAHRLLYPDADGEGDGGVARAS